MKTKKDKRFDQNVATLDSDLNVNNKLHADKKMRARTWLLNLILNMFRPLFEREIYKIDSMDLNEMPSARIMKIHKNRTLSFEPNLVYDLKRIEMTIDVSHPDTRKVMRLYLTGHTIVDVKERLSIRNIAILNHIHLFHFNVKI